MFYNISIIIPFFNASKLLNESIRNSKKIVKRNVNVFNAASASFNSSQELIVLGKSLDINFDLVVSLSGLHGPQVLLE